MALCMILKSFGDVTITVTSSAYAKPLCSALTLFWYQAGCSPTFGVWGAGKCVQQHAQRAALSYGALDHNRFSQVPVFVPRPLPSHTGTLCVQWTKGLYHNFSGLWRGIGVRVCRKLPESLTWARVKRCWFSRLVLLPRALLTPPLWLSCRGCCRTGWSGDVPPAPGVGGAPISGLVSCSLSWVASLVGILPVSALHLT